jgi:hypothetical protein
MVLISRVYGLRLGDGGWLRAMRFISPEQSSSESLVKWQRRELRSIRRLLERELTLHIAA